MLQRPPLQTFPPDNAGAKRARFIFFGLLSLLFILAVAVYWVIFHPKSPGAAQTGLLSSRASAPTPLPKIASRLNGSLVDPKDANLTPLAVMIENHPDARPQSGLAQADYVVEAIAEGGITRFMAVYGNPNQPVTVGPIRSARTYFVDFAKELNAFYAHVGGSTTGLSEIQKVNLSDLDQFQVGAPTYNRKPKAGVALEHTMFSTTAKLWQYATETKHWSTTANYTAWQFKDDAPVAERPASQIVSVSVSSPAFAVKWTYDPTDNSYSRSMAGTPHKDAETNQVIRAKAIILQTVDRQQIVDQATKELWQYSLTGSGKAKIIQDGQVIDATWRKSGNERTRFYTAEGTEITFVRGHLWHQLIHPDTTLTFN